MSKRIIITGAASGIGREIAYLMSEQKHRLLLIDKKSDDLNETTQNCLKKGATCALAMDVDITDLKKLEIIPKKVDELGEGQIVFVSNAGITFPGAFTDRSLDQIHMMVNANMLGPMTMAHHLIPLMLKQQTGQVIIVSSIAAKYIFDASAVYCASKAGLLAFGRILSEEFRQRGIRVTNILPGSVDTPLWNQHPSHPPKEDMLTSTAVAELVRDVILMPEDRAIDCIEIMPPKGTLGRTARLTTY